MTNFTKSVVEEATLAWLEALGYALLHRLFTCSVTRRAGAPDTSLDVVPFLRYIFITTDTMEQ